MKVVVADTSPLNYLVLIGQVDVLSQLYGEVLIPDIVAQELCAAGGSAMGVSPPALDQHQTDAGLV